MSARLFRHAGLTVGDVEYQTDIAARATQPTAYAPARLTRSRQTALDDYDPARFTVDVSVPPENDGRVLRTNYCPDPRYIGPDGVVGGTGGAVTQDDLPSGAPDGRGYTSITLSGDQTGNIFAGNDLFDASELVIGQTYTTSVHLLSPRSGGIDVRLVWIDSVGGQVGQELENNTIVAGEWTRIDVSGVMPSGATQYRIVGTFQNSLGLLSGDTIGIAQRALVDGPTAGAYFDGGTPDTPTRLYSWADTVNQSVSTEATPDQRPQLGDRVTVRLNASDDDPSTAGVVVLDGAVQSMGRQFGKEFRTSDGDTFHADVYELDATDWLGVVARRTIGAAPFPEETPQQRWARIANLIPDVPFVLNIDGANTVAARDVDNVSVLDLLRDTVAISDGVVLCEGEAGMSSRSRSAINQPPDSNADVIVDIPAELVTDPGDVQDYDLVINVARVTGKVTDPESESGYADRTLTYTNDASRALHGESVWSTSGDGVGTAGPGLEGSAAALRAQDIVQHAGNPMWRLADAVDVLAYRVGAPGVPAFSTTELRRLFFLTWGGLDLMVRFVGAQPGRDVWRLIGMDMEWGGPDGDVLRFELEPPELALID